MAAAELDVSMDLPPLDAENANPNQEVTATKSKKASKKTIEHTYQKTTQLEHILLRPDTYIGSTEAVTQHLFVLDAETGRLQARDVTFTPGLYKIFDEILVNAVDNKQRDPNMYRLKVTVDAEANLILVLNNGKVSRRFWRCQRARRGTRRRPVAGAGGARPVAAGGRRSHLRHVGGRRTDARGRIRPTWERVAPSQTSNLGPVCRGTASVSATGWQRRRVRAAARPPAAVSERRAVVTVAPGTSC